MQAPVDVAGHQITSALHRPSTIGELYLRAIRRHGDQEALADEHRTLTYRQFGASVAGLVKRFDVAGLRCGDAIAQLSGNKLDAICIIAAAFVAGLRYTPLHPLGAEADQAFILDDAEIDCLVVDELRFAERGAILARGLRGKRLVFTHGLASYGERLDALADVSTAVDLPTCKARPEDIALIAYTGGTTGRPKGVVHRHGSLVANLLIAMSEWDWGVPVRFLVVTPISHAAFLFILPALLRGGSVAVTNGFTPRGFVDAIRMHQSTTTFLVPTMIYGLLEKFAELRAMPSLQTIIYGAAPMEPHRLRAAMECFGPKFAQLYGQTEAPNAICAMFKRHHDANDLVRLGSCGVPLAGNDVRLLRPDGTEATVGEDGELCVRGPLVMDGYWKREQETARAFSDGWLHTGDVARADADGFIYLIDRTSDVIISGGFNVYPREVEDALCTHPDVVQCCVFGVPDAKWGEAVMAAVVLRHGATVAIDALIAHVKTVKGAVHAPKRVDCVERLPLTSLGKVDRRALRAPHWEGAGRQIG